MATKQKVAFDPEELIEPIIPTSKEAFDMFDKRIDLASIMTTEGLMYRDGSFADEPY